MLQNMKKKISVTENYLAHLSHAKEEHNYYNNNMGPLQ